MELAPVDPTTSRPKTDIRIKDVTIFVDPFEEYMNQREEAGDAAATGAQNVKKEEAVRNEDDDQLTWTGKRVRRLDESRSSDTGDGRGVGKYLKAALADQPRGGQDDEDEIVEFVDDPQPEPPQHVRKKFKTGGGFGNFEGW
jgi:peptidyl-prolyl cis-trans isomerase-like protein 2